MRLKVVFIIALIAMVCVASGCATARRQKDMEIQGLRNQVSLLESQLQSKDDEIALLREDLNRLEQERGASEKKKPVAEVKSRPKVKDIQIALRNAGYDPGAIDGRMGKKTRDAIRSFQRANGLAVDGKVGKQTWALLKDYLGKKIK